MPLPTNLADYGVLVVIGIQTIIFGILYRRQNKIMEEQAKIMKSQTRLTKIMFGQETAKYIAAYLKVVEHLLKLEKMSLIYILKGIESPNCTELKEDVAYYSTQLSLLLDKENAGDFLLSLVDTLNGLIEKGEFMIPDSIKDNVLDIIEDTLNKLKEEYYLTPEYQEIATKCLMNLKLRE